MYSYGLIVKSVYVFMKGKSENTIKKIEKYSYHIVGILVL